MFPKFLRLSGAGNSALELCAPLPSEKVGGDRWAHWAFECFFGDTKRVKLEELTKFNPPMHTQMPMHHTDLGHHNGNHKHKQNHLT